VPAAGSLVVLAEASCRFSEPAHATRKYKAGRNEQKSWTAFAGPPALRLSLEAGFIK
jgi:hypothetical protein